MSRRSARLDGEELIVALWRDDDRLPYGGYCRCANPDCGEMTYCRGANPVSRVCLACFEFVFNMSPPNFRRRRNLALASAT